MIFRASEKSGATALDASRGDWALDAWEGAATDSPSRPIESQCLLTAVSYPESEVVPPGRAEDWSLLVAQLSVARLSGSGFRVAWRVEERQHGSREHRRHTDLVVRHVRNDGEAVLRHVLARPAGVFEPAAEQLIERDDVFGADHVGVAIDEHHRHRELLHI